jgi:adenylate cyclase
MKGRLKAEYESLGEHRLPDIAEPVHAYRVLKKPEKSIHVFGKTWLLSHLETRLDIIKVIVLAMSVLVGIAGLWNTYFRSAPPPAGVASVQRMALPLPDKPSIAVLPFENMTGDPKQEYFADGFTEQIITSLSKITGLFVIARNSSFTYKGKPVKVQQVSEELGVRYVLEGSIQKSGTRVRINAQLIDAVSGKHLWAEHYDRQLKDIFALQDEIILKILTALQVNLTAGEQARVWAKGTKNLDAYLKLMQVRENVFRMNRESNVRARQLAEETIALDPKYAEAYSWMGATYYLEVFYGLSKSPKDSLAQAVEWERKALAIDNSLALAYARLGYTYSLMKRHEEGIAALEKAVVMDPNAALTHQFLGAALRFAGRPEEAILEIKQAIRLEPFTPGIYYMNLGLSYLLKGDCEEAVKACEKGLERERDNLLSYIMATAVYGSCGRDEAARRTAKEILRLNPKFSTESSAKKLPYKNPKDLDQVLEGLRKAGLP